MMQSVPTPTRKSRPIRRWLLAGALLGSIATIGCFVGSWWRVTSHLAEARRALAAGDPQTALRFLQAAQRIGPERAEVAYLLAVANRRAGLLDPFALYLSRAAELGWSRDDIQRQAWLAIAQAGDVPSVKQRLMEVVTEGASDEVAEEVYEAVARGHLVAYRLRDAWTCLDMWLRWRPDVPQARIMRACIYEQTGEYASAADDYRAVLGEFPEHREARIRLGWALMWLTKYDEAKEQFQIRLGVVPEDPDALVGLAQCERHTGNVAEARRLLESALQLNLSRHQRGLALREMGQVFLSEGKTSEAIEALTQALALLPGESQVHHALGAALARAGRTREAQYHHDRLREIRRDYERINHVTRRLMDEPRNADLRCEAGEILIRQGLSREGVDWVLTALKCNPRHRKSHQVLADYYAKAGNQELAAEHRLAAAAMANPPQSLKRD
jgi:tetratricopeptide (TPR) repeat protein